MRFQDIKRKLIIESSVILGVLSLFSGCTYYLTSVSDGYVQDKRNLENQVAAVTNEKQVLQEKYAKLQANEKLFRELLEQNANDRFSIGRQFLRKKVNEFKTRYFLNDLTLTMAPVQELQGPKYKYGTGMIVSSDLTVIIDALTDEDIYGLTSAIQEEFPGAVKITKFNVSRQQKVTDESLRVITRIGQYSMVRGTVHLTWFGIRAPETPNAGDSPPRKAP